MLFLPLLDRAWCLPRLPRSRPHVTSWILFLALLAAPAAWVQHYPAHALATLLLTALPEEWFFRGYFMGRIGTGLRANLIASTLFSLMHALTQDWMTALLVFPPSLLYGWLYYRTRDLLLVILVHALSNIVYTFFLMQYVSAFLNK